MNKAAKHGARKVSEVEWIAEAKKILGDQAFNSSPLNLIAKKEWASNCEIEKWPKKNEHGDIDAITIKAGDELDCIYMVIKGRVGIGGKHDGCYVERLSIEPFSFIGEIEAPFSIKINKAIPQKTYTFKKSVFQDNAWVSSELLSKLLAWDRLEYNIGAEDETSPLIRDNELPGVFKKYDLYTRNAEAHLLKIPLDCIPEIMNNEELCQLLYQDAFIKSKRYCYISELKELGAKIISVYHYAEINNLLATDGGLYIIGTNRLNAICGVTYASKAKHKKEIVNYLQSKNFRWDQHSGAFDKLTNVIPDTDLRDIWKFDSKYIPNKNTDNENKDSRKGGNKSIYKISRMSNT